MKHMTKEELLEAMQRGERLYADDHLLGLGDPAQFVPVGIVRELLREGAIIERVLAADYSEFELAAGAWFGIR
jgi:hypothetical protein